ncbi:MAG: FAD binding domain-containing protein [Desulfobacterales bacterium]|jgi:xanthine dehydrogenase YagS FAD-binding subunit
MKSFQHENAQSIPEAVSLLGSVKSAKVIAGGTDLLGGLRGGIYMDPPDFLVNLKNIPELKGIKAEKKEITIGAATTLTEITQSSLIKEKLPVLDLAVQKTASKLLRNSGTIGGNICQENRCWYYRYPDQLGGRIDCVRKGGKKCLAITGELGHHSIFGAVNKCVAVNPSDTAPALTVLEAKIITDRRTIAVEEFFTSKNGRHSTVLENDEIVVKIAVPLPLAGSKGHFEKMSTRKSIDFAIVSCAAQILTEKEKIKKANICLGGVHCNPYPIKSAGEFLAGKKPSSELFNEFAEQAMAKARPFPKNKYKVYISKTMIRDTLEKCC